MSDKAPQTIDKLPQVNLVEERYKNGKSYMRSRSFLDRWPEYERMKAGDQWPPPTERTRSLPRPVFNIIDFIENHKVSSVMNENVKMLFSSQEVDGGNDPNDQALVQQAQEAADTFTRYSETVWENIKQDELNEEALESASNIGTAIWHYYWDTSKKGGLTMPYEGEICGEILDAINVFFGNPQQRNVQKQPYIVITSREMVETVRAEARANGLSEEMVMMISGDTDVNDEGYDSAKIEVGDGAKVTVITQYWKEKGKVMFCKAASAQLIKKTTPSGFKLYPIAVMQWKRRKKSIHGIGDTEGIVPNQKAINYLLAMSVLSAQITGWPKMKINPNYVDPNSLNNDPSMPLIDMSPPGHSGAEYMNPGVMSPHVAPLIDSFIDYTKSLSSAQDASTGDVGKGQLNAAAIMLLQKAAGVPIESIKKRFYRVMEDIGRIWEEFWKVKYNTNRRVNLKDDDGNEYTQDFKGSDYADINFNLKIDIGPSSQYSEELMMASLDKIYEKGDIDIIDYLESAPKNVVPFKDKLLKRLQDKQMAMQQQAEAEAAAAAEQERNALNAQPDPALEAQLKTEQQMALKDQEHGHKMQLEELKGQNQMSVASMKQPAAK